MFFTWKKFEQVIKKVKTSLRFNDQAIKLIRFLMTALSRRPELSILKSRHCSRLCRCRRCCRQCRQRRRDILESNSFNVVIGKVFAAVAASSLVATNGKVF